MEGVEDHSVKAPLIVVDGANVAFAYGKAAQQQQSIIHGKPAPDVRGLLVATQFFGEASCCHVRIVLTQSWLRQHQDPEQLAILQELAGQLVTAPVTDDDDAYALQIAQRENAIRRRRRGNNCRPHGLAYVLSNDLFRDAQERQQDDGEDLSRWLNEGYSAETGPGRISFAFGDLGRLDDHGDPVLDFLPNPRHPLVAWVEQQHRQRQQQATG